MNNNRLYYHCLFSVIISTISILFSVASLCKVSPRIVSEENPGFDYMGIIVGVLSLLIAFLVGWQIYKTIDIENKIKEVTNGSRNAIADDMFYKWYGELMESNMNLYKFRYALKSCVAALNLDFNEEKGSCLYEAIKTVLSSINHPYISSDEANDNIDMIINELDKLRYSSKCIKDCYKYLNDKKKVNK